MANLSGSKVFVPSKLKIFGRDVEVVFRDDYITQDGGAEYSTSTIFVKSGQQRLLEADTLLHECIHFIDEILQLKMTERQVFCVAGAILTILRDNPELFDYFKEATENPRKV